SESPVSGKVSASGTPTAAITETVTRLGPAGHEYRLRAIEAINYDGRTLRVGSFSADGATLAEALEKMGIEVHRMFQYLWHRPPPDRTAEENERWEQLSELIDIDYYLERHPPEESVIGRVEDIDVAGLTCVLLTENPEERVRSLWSALPAAAAASQAGDYFI